MRRSKGGFRLKGSRRFGAILSALALSLLAHPFAATPAIADGPASPTEVVSPDGLDGYVAVERLPTPSDLRLVAGQAVWAETCEACHGGNDLVGAPKITSENDWSARTAKGLEALFTNAKEGFLGPTYKEMPARGGNSDLTDEDVEAAVAFMVWTSGGAAEVETWLANLSDH